MTTDLEEPPAFLSGRRGPLPAAWKPRIAASYPFLRPLRVTGRRPSGSPATPASAAAGSTIPTDAASLQHLVADRVVALARGMPRWQLERVEGAAGQAAEGAAPSGDTTGARPPAGEVVVEGVAITRLMRFKDDFVIRIRQEPFGAAKGGAGEGGSPSVRVDMRSASRVGKGDLGTNAARVRGFLEALREDLTAQGLAVA